MINLFIFTYKHLENKVSFQLGKKKLLGENITLYFKGNFYIPHI